MQRLAGLYLIWHIQNVRARPRAGPLDRLVSTLKSFPTDVQRSVGFNLFRAQEGKKAPNAKPLKGIVKGAGVLEITEDHDSDTYRVVYTVRFPTRVYVLHSFQKKSRKGVATPKHEIDLIRRRYEMARAHHDQSQEDL